MDLLKELYEGRISDDEASDIFCDTNEMDTDESAESLLGIDNDEFSAYAQGAPWSVVAKWRYEGWPDTCSETGLPIDHKKIHCLVKQINENTYGLVKLWTPQISFHIGLLSDLLNGKIACSTYVSVLLHVCYLDDKSNTVYEEDELNILNPFVQKLADAYDEKNIDEKDILSQAAQVLDELKKPLLKGLYECP